MTITDHQQHLESSFSRGSTALLKSRSVFDVDHKIIDFLWTTKLAPAIQKDNHGLDSSEFTCWVLPAIEKPASDTPLKRKRRLAANPRGAYAKASYSFTGSYAQTTYTKAEHKLLFKSSSQVSFPITRTFQATHVSLLQHDKRPPMDSWQLYQASHVCGYSKCIRPTHLMWETIDMNFSRRMCHVFGAFEDCPHDPVCLLRQPYGRFRQVISNNTTID